MGTQFKKIAVIVQKVYIKKKEFKFFKGLYTAISKVGLSMALLSGAMRN